MTRQAFFKILKNIALIQNIETDFSPHMPQHFSDARNTSAAGTAQEPYGYGNSWCKYMGKAGAGNEATAS